MPFGINNLFVYPALSAVDIAFLDGTDQDFLESDEPLGIIDFYRSIFESVTAGCCMNKTHWNTVCVDGDVPESELHEMIQYSHDLIKPKVRKWRIGGRSANNSKQGDVSRIPPA